MWVWLFVSGSLSLEELHSVLARTLYQAVFWLTSAARAETGRRTFSAQAWTGWIRSVRITLSSLTETTQSSFRLSVMLKLEACRQMCELPGV